MYNSEPNLIQDIDQDQNQGKKIRLLIIVATIAFVLVIITISIIITSLQPKTEATISNDSGHDSNQLPDEDYTRLKEETLSLSKRNSEGAINSVDATVRWNTIQKQQQGGREVTTFLIDIDEQKQTYKVIQDEYNTYLSCPQIGESKYPESFCFGNYGEKDNSFRIVFGDLLPYDGETEFGDYYTIMAPPLSVTNKALEIWIYNCPENDATAQRVSDAVDELIRSLGASPNIFEKKINFYGCSHYSE